VSQENVDRYRRSIALWNSGDLDAVLALAATEPDSEFRTSGVFPGVDRVYRGVEGVRQLWTDMRGPWEKLHIRIERMEDLGDTLLALFTFEATGRDGIAATQQWAHVVKFDPGKTTITENYSSWPEALKAVGLEE
jgi:ketosteroid isomerase-like protein